MPSEQFDPFNPQHTANLPDADFSNIDFNDPESVFKALGGGAGTNLPIPKTITPGEVRKQAKQLSSEIFADWNLLRDILDRHEPTIHKRWTKKTKNQRVEILLAAWPNMSSSHRPDFAAFRKESEQEREAGTKFREAYLWPYINLEDLAKPKTLPLLLQARAGNPPDVFAMADENAAHIGYITKAIVPVFLNEHTMMFTGRRTPERYGELIDWEDDERAFEWMNSRKGMLPGSGLIVLEMQQQVMRFLVDYCKHVMHDIPAEELASDQYPTQPRVSLPGETADGFFSLSVMANEAPYRSPANMDLARLESLFAAKVGAAEDHIWSLREDPGYFAESLFDYKEHRQEVIKDWNGRDHPLFRLNRTEILWVRIIANVIGNAHLYLEIWTELLSQIKGLRRLQAKYAAQISPESDLPDEYLNSLLKFQHYLQQATKGPLGMLKHHAVASPPLRPHFVREPVENPMTTKIRVRQKSNKLSKIENELLWLLTVLWEDDRHLFFLGKTNAVDELGRLMQSEAEAKNMISSSIAGVIGDLTILTEGLRQVNTYQPWAQRFEDQLVDNEEEIKQEYSQKTAHWGQLLESTSGIDQTRLVKLGTPEQGRFNYPVEKRRTKENVEAMRHAEKDLDIFWGAVDLNLRNNLGGKLDDMALRRLLSSPRILQRTPEWVEPAKKEGNQKAEKAMEAIEEPMSKLYLDLGHKADGTSGRKVLQNKKVTTKEKRKGIPAQADTDEAINPPPNATPDEQTTFAVDARALKVFRTLFYSPSASATPGEVAWTDFLHAMVSTGFVAEKLYGSVWQFSPTKLDVERSIQFHEPHPVGKLAYKTARRFGRRLERAYGWVGEMFVLKEKSKG